MRAEASCGAGKWVLYCTFFSEKQGLRVFRKVAEALLNNGGGLRKRRKVEGRRMS